MTNASKPVLKLRGEVLYNPAFSMTAAEEEALVILQYYAIRKKIQSPMLGIFRVDNGGQNDRIRCRMDDPRFKIKVQGSRGRNEIPDSRFRIETNF